MQIKNGVNTKSHTLVLLYNIFCEIITLLHLSHVFIYSFKSKKNVSLSVISGLHLHEILSFIFRHILSGVAIANQLFSELHIWFIRRFYCQDSVLHFVFSIMFLFLVMFWVVLLSVTPSSRWSFTAVVISVNHSLCHLVCFSMFFFFFSCFG